MGDEIKENAYQNQFLLTELNVINFNNIDFFML